MRNLKLLTTLIIFFALFWGCSSYRHKVLEKIPPELPPVSPDTQKIAEVKPSDKAQTQKTSILRETKSLNGEDPLFQENNLSEERGEAANFLEEVLNTYQEALSAWERGESEEALAALDDAYSIILKVKLPQDSPLAQEKKDLRLLIAQRIQEICASHFTAVRDNHKTIPLVENKYVNAEIESFQTRERKYFEEAFQRAGLYREMIVGELRKAGLPDQLSWLPLIESWFKIRALSRARALGLWQFVSSTGYRFGLTRDRWVDERMDPLKSTQAAVKYLEDLHSFFGDWTTALAAYNCGEVRIQNVIRAQRINYLDNFWDLYINLPQETSRFVPRFIAAILIIENPEKYGFNLPAPYEPIKLETITINHPTKLSSLSSALGLEPSELSLLNPELRQEATPDRSYQLKIPAGLSEKAMMAINSLPRWIPPEATFIWHSVRNGETLSTIANRYRTSVSAIARLNGLVRVNIIRPGQRLKIPSKGVVSETSADPQN